MEQGHSGGRCAVRGDRRSAAGHAQSVRSAAAVRFGHIGGRDRVCRRSGRLRLDAGRVARLFAHVRQERAASAAGVLLPEKGGQKSAPPAL